MESSRQVGLASFIHLCPSTYETFLHLLRPLIFEEHDSSGDLVEEGHSWRGVVSTWGCLSSGTRPG